MLLASHFPLILIESREEARVLHLVREAGQRPAAAANGASSSGPPRTACAASTSTWAPPQKHAHRAGRTAAAPEGTTPPGVYVLLDFHPYLADPVNVRMIKDVAQAYEKVPRTLVLISHEVTVPQELEHLTARLKLGMPSRNERP